MSLDFNVYDSGSIVLLHPLTEAADEWVEEHLPEDRQCLGKNVAIERRYFADIYNGIRSDGLSIA